MSTVPRKWVTSDTHFGHANILKYDKRPFKTIQEHDEKLVENWNNTVGDEDEVYHVGDFSFDAKPEQVHDRLRMLKGIKHLIYGNHDKIARKCTRDKFPFGWHSVQPYLEVKWEDQKVCLFHYRMTVWNRSHHGSWALHGHSHGSLPKLMNSKTFDVGTMCWDYTPISFERVREEMSFKSFVPVDNHGSSRLVTLTFKTGETFELNVPEHYYKFVSTLNAFGDINGGVVRIDMTGAQFEWFQHMWGEQFTDNFGHRGLYGIPIILKEGLR